MTLDFEGSQLSPDERVTEKNLIMRMIEGASQDTLSERETAFLSDMELAIVVTPRQLAWLRQIKDKVME